MLPDAPYKASNNLNFVQFTRTQDSQEDSENTGVPDEAWSYMPREGRLKIERHGHSATVHIWPSTEALPHVKVEESVFSGADLVRTPPGTDEVKVKRDLDVHTSGRKRLRIMTPTTAQTASRSSVISSAELRELGEIQQVVRSAGQMPPPVPPAHPIPFNPLDEPSPLGLTLRKTPSLVDLIQMKLTQNDLAIPRSSNVEAPEMASRGRKSSSMSSITQQDKLKASNFPASILKIGTWECVSRYEGDLVAKCYYAKKKLVWEVLENGLKSKVEIQWSDITALKASCPDSEQGVLDIEVSRPPLFFKETNPQPRKHTLWQATSDFTGGQATICKRHYLNFSPGLLNRHYEKLMQCDPRLKSLSEKAISSRESDFFEQHCEKVEVQHDQKKFQLAQQDEESHITQFDSRHLPTYSNSHTVIGSAELQHTGIMPKREPVELDDRMTEFTTGSPSTSSGMDSQGHDDSSYTSSREGLHFLEHTVDSAKDDYMNHRIVGNQYMDQFSESVSIPRSSCCPSLAIGDANRQMLDELAYHLLGEPLLPTFNEQTNCARLNLMSSLQMDTIYTPDLPVSCVPTSRLFSQAQPGASLSFQERTIYEQRQRKENMGGMAFGGRRLPSEEMIKSSFGPSLFRMSKRESSGDLLFNIPRIASLPQFFEPALHGLVTCPEPPRSGDSEYK